jgi:DNA-binding protein YbaB
MTHYEYPEYHADKSRVQSVMARLDRVSEMLKKMSADLAGINVEAVGGDGDVTLSVNHCGQLVSLSFGVGVTKRYTAGALSELINNTLAHAVDAAINASEEITGADPLELEVMA